MTRLIIGIVLLVAGAIGTASTNTIFVGAIVIGIVNIGRGIYQLSQQNSHPPGPPQY